MTSPPTGHPVPSPQPLCVLIPCCVKDFELSIDSNNVKPQETQWLFPAMDITPVFRLALKTTAPVLCVLQHTYSTNGTVAWDLAVHQCASAEVTRIDKAAVSCCMLEREKAQIPCD